MRGRGIRSTGTWRHVVILNRGVKEGFIKRDSFEQSLKEMSDLAKRI